MSTNGKLVLCKRHLLWCESLSVFSWGIDHITVLAEFWLYLLFLFLGDTIPGGATLIFDVELVSIRDGPKPQNIFKEIDADDDKLLSKDEVMLIFLSFFLFQVQDIS